LAGCLHSFPGNRFAQAQYSGTGLKRLFGVFPAFQEGGDIGPGFFPGFRGLGACGTFKKT
jgi:hypothetical protein